MSMQELIDRVSPKYFLNSECHSHSFSLSRCRPPDSQANALAPTRYTCIPGESKSQHTYTMTRLQEGMTSICAASDALAMMLLQRVMYTNATPTTNMLSGVCLRLAYYTQMHASIIYLLQSRMSCYKGVFSTAYHHSGMGKDVAYAASETLR